MNYLEPIHKNSSGIVYTVKDFDKEDYSDKIQLQIGDFAILMRAEEMPNFLKVIKSVKKKSNCSNCNEKPRVIKCETQYASVKIKVTPTAIEDLEELVLATICYYQVEDILRENNIG